MFHLIFRVKLLYLEHGNVTSHLLFLFGITNACHRNVRNLLLYLFYKKEFKE